MPLIQLLLGSSRKERNLIRLRSHQLHLLDLRIQQNLHEVSELMVQKLGRLDLLLLVQTKIASN